MSDSINILHLSDLHFSKRSDAYNRSFILTALKEDLKKLSDGPLKPDLIAFTGDLVNSADEDDVYLYLYDELLADIAKITRCSESRFFYLPR